MPKYRVNLLYHGSAAYDVEAVDEVSAIVKAQGLRVCEPELEFLERLILDFVDSDVYEDKEE